ncbi:MAG TPA: hypothetical protein VGR95_03105 [Thermoanaerobaculia bacterium]|nr:hypothetical protein [Thermoanaerobaculia bacterium]
MAGWGTTVVQALPNFQTVFTPRPRFFITFGNYSRGQVLDTRLITTKAEISFPPGVLSMTATLNPDFTWTITQTPLLLEDEEE